MMSPSCSTSAPTAGVGLLHCTKPHALSEQTRRVILTPLASDLAVSAIGCAHRGQNLNVSITACPLNQTWMVAHAGDRDGVVRDGRGGVGARGEVNPCDYTKHLHVDTDTSTGHSER